MQTQAVFALKGKPLNTYGLTCSCSFYLHPHSVQDVVDASVARVLDLIDVPHTLATRWAGLPAPLATAS